MDHELPVLSAIERAAEVTRFTTAQFEFWLSPLGNLREFLRLNFRMAIVIAAPALLIAPFISMVLERFKQWTIMLTETVSSFVLFPLSVILSILLVCGCLYIGRSLMEMRVRSSRRDGYY